MQQIYSDRLYNKCMKTGLHLYQQQLQCSQGMANDGTTVLE